MDYSRELDRIAEGAQGLRLAAESLNNTLSGVETSLSKIADGLEAFFNLLNNGELFIEEVKDGLFRVAVYHEQIAEAQKKEGGE